MEIGSFIELQFPKGKEFYTGDNVCRLNTGRTAIYHAFLQTKCIKIYLPVYQCETVSQFLKKKKVEIEYYNIDRDFRPILDKIEDNAAILLVNYFGVFSTQEMCERAKLFKNVIIDNCPAFFAKPIKETFSIYSTRKFFGVPDGAYVIGEGMSSNVEYDYDHSSDTSNFLLRRIEYGCEGKVYHEREQNEKRLNESDIMQMSKLTRAILDGIDYEQNIEIRKKNFLYAKELLDSINEIDTSKFYDASCVPMVYPLLVRDDNLLSRLLAAKHFQGNWWKYILEIPIANQFEKDLSRYMIPITIDQRYNSTHLDYIKSFI